MIDFGSAQEIDRDKLVKVVGRFMVKKMQNKVACVMENRRAIEARQQSLHAELVAARQARPISLEVLPRNYDD